jgi:chemotaxis protein MotB
MRPRRGRPAEEPTNHDRWLISYSDFITLLFAFFVVLFASSYRDNQKIKKISEAIHIGFQSMGAFSGGQSDAGVAYHDITPDPTVCAQKIEQTRQETKSPASDLDIVELRRQLEAAIGQEIKNHEVDTRVTPEGFVISLKELGFFDSGQAVLLPGAAVKVERIAKVLSQHGLELRVEGHTDDQPIHTAQFRSNWDLSTARAMAVMQHLVNDSGFDPGKISVAAYGQYRPVADNSTPDGRRMNRRVDLVVVSTAPAPLAASAIGN